MKKYLLLIALFVWGNSFAQLTPAQVTTAIDANVFQNNTKSIRGDSLNAVLKYILNAYNIPPLLQDGFISPVTVTWIANYDYQVSPAVYVIGGVLYSSPSTLITLAAADATDDRIDLFVVTTSSTAVAVTGTAAPTPLEPDIDASIQLKASFAVVQASTTQPAAMATEWIYQENIEWVYSDNTANLNPASTNNPYSGTKDIEGTTVATGNSFTLTPATFPALTNYNALVFKIRSKSAWGNQRRVIIQFMLGGIPIGNAVTFGNNAYGYNSGITGSYQNVSVPLSDFGNLTGATALRYIASMPNGSIGFYIDDIELTAISNVNGNQVQPDWTQTDSNAVNYIQHKPNYGTGTDNQLTRWDGTGVTKFQNSGIVVSDATVNIITATIANEFRIQTSGASAPVGNQIQLLGANNGGTNRGGGITLTGGTASGSTNGGPILIRGGAGTSTSAGGTVTILGGSTTGASGDAGTISIQGGASTNGIGGTITLSGGIGGGGNGVVSIGNASSFTGTLDVSGLTANRIFTFPDVAGTLALTSSGISEANSGTFVLGVDTIFTANVGASSLIFLSGAGGTITNLGIPYEDAANRSAGVYFIVKSTNTLDASTFRYAIVEPH